MRSLSLKLTLAFLFVGIIGAVLVAVFVGLQTRRQFDRFLSDNYEAALVDRLIIYYEQYGSWQGANRILMQVYRDEDAPRLEQRALPWMVVDENGKLVVGGSSGNPDRPERQISERDLKDGSPIYVNGELVGYLVRIPFQREPGQNPSPEETFIARVTQGIWLSFGAAAVVALLVGFLLARTITNPIKALTVATTAVAGGELGRQVEVKSKDEIGELADSFNKMSTDLADASQQRRQMTADIAHELRTPLSIIMGYTESLRDILPPNLETFDIIHDEAENLSRLVQDLRTLSLAEAGKLALHVESLPPLELLQTVAAKYKHQAEQKNISLQVDVAANLPEIEVDPGRMAQVLGNLVSNALRFTPAYGEIGLTAVQPTTTHIQFTVSDNGAGIPADVLPKVFDRFYKADQSRQAHEGESGLGLAIARSIVRMHEGTIEVTSVLGKGTAFTITLPIKRLEIGD